MHMVFENSRSRSPGQHYVWSEKALSIVRSTRIPKKDGALVVQQLQALTGYPEKACWRLAERFGFRRPNARRVWSQEDVARIIELSETTCIREIAERSHQQTRHDPSPISNPWLKSTTLVKPGHRRLANRRLSELLCLA
jgi:hypothetical protein